jgi:DNA polymerase-1
VLVEFKGVNGRIFKGEVINSEPRLKSLCNRLHKLSEFAVDTEDTSLDVQWRGKSELVGISISWGACHNYYIPVGHYFDDDQLDLELVFKYLKPELERPDKVYIGHNLKYDAHVFANYDIDIFKGEIFDTMVGAWDVDENRPKNLKELTHIVYGIPQMEFDECVSTVSKEDKKAYGLKANMKAPIQLVRYRIGASYAMGDTYWCWRHYVDWIQQGIEDEGYTAIYHQQMKFLKTLFNMERRGIRVDRDRLAQMQKKATKDLEDLAYEIYEIFGQEFKITSNQQLAEVLFGYKKYKKDKKTGAKVFCGNQNLIDMSYEFPIQGMTKGGKNSEPAPATGDDALQALVKLHYKKDKKKQEGIKLVKLVLKFKKLAKLKTAFMDGLLKQMYSDGKIHPSYNQCGTDSGRLSCQNPNLQQLPRPVEMPKEPKKENYAEDSVYEKAVQKYKYDKGVADFWKYYEIRDAFISDSDNDVIIACDFKNLEMCLLAHFSLDENLVRTFNEGHDVHGSTAVNMFNLPCTADEAKKKYPPLRQVAKTINFGQQIA